MSGAFNFILGTPFEDHKLVCRRAGGQFVRQRGRRPSTARSRHIAAWQIGCSNSKQNDENKQPPSRQLFMREDDSAIGLYSTCWPTKSISLILANRNEPSKYLQNMDRTRRPL